MNNNFNSTVNSFLGALKNENNYTHTWNGAVAKKSTGSKLYDLFSLGASYRAHNEVDCILLFKEAYIENPSYALRCLAYLRDIESQGQGERRFFRVILKWFAGYDKRAIARNLEYMVQNNICRWDDILVLFDTEAEDTAMDLIRKQLTKDMAAMRSSETAPVSLCAKWMPSCNTSSAKTKALGRKVAHNLGITERQYRKMLSALRNRINIVERLMSENRWSEIEFDKLPSRAGLIYRKAFERHELTQKKYREFAKSDKTVNAGKLYPYDIVREVEKLMDCGSYYCHKNVALDSTERLMLNKYWANLDSVIPQDVPFNGMVVCDTSASMLCGASNTATPMQVAVSLAIYAAERAQGPFKNHYISFSHNAKLIEVKGVDFCDKVDRIMRANLCQDTNLESVFDLVLSTAMKYHLPQNQIPQTLVVVSDQQVNSATDYGFNQDTFMQSMRKKWMATCGGKYEMPSLVFWNVNAANPTFLDDLRSGITFCSGASPTLFNQIVRGNSGEDLMWDALNNERYIPIK